MMEDFRGRGSVDTTITDGAHLSVLDASDICNLGLSMQAVPIGLGFLLVQLHEKRQETGQISASLSLKLWICNST